MWQHPYVNICKRAGVGNTWRKIKREGDALFVMDKSVRAWTVHGIGSVHSSVLHLLVLLYLNLGRKKIRLTHAEEIHDGAISHKVRVEESAEPYLSGQLIDKQMVLSK